MDEVLGSSSSRALLVARPRAIATLLTLATLVVQVVAAGGRADGSAAAFSPASRLNVTSICLRTPYPRACAMVLSPAARSWSRPSLLARDSSDPFVASVRFAMAQALSARALARNYSSSSSSSSSSTRLRGGARQRRSGMDDCAELLDISHDHLAHVLLASRDDDDGAVTTWLSAAMTNQRTCADSITTATAVTITAAARDAVRARVAALERFVGTALALHATSKVNTVNAAAGGPAASSSMSPSTSAEEEEAGLPAWVSEHDKKLLLSSAPTSTGVMHDAVVAMDGSGTHRSIREAIADVTAAAAVKGGGGGGRKVIYVKAGRYEESVTISNKQRNVMLMGDGVGKTVIVDDKSVGGGYTTYASATVAAMGSGFIAKGLTIINSAGPGKGQAVALRVGGDLSVVYQCAIQAYQDTLYVHSNRQFYAACDIAGTVDFIFGNAAAVLQGCNIQARRPMSGQEDTVTAQGRTDPNQNTGIAIHRCRISAASDLGGTPVYLGRPWQRYSRTVVMKTFLDGAIAPAGWLEWNGQFGLSTLYYGEYGNTGPGAGISRRVTWSGVHSSMSTSDATRFTVAEFIMGNSWLGGTGVTYVSGL